MCNSYTKITRRVYKHIFGRPDKTYRLELRPTALFQNCALVHAKRSIRSLSSKTHWTWQHTVFRIFRKKRCFVPLQIEHKASSLLQELALTKRNRNASHFCFSASAASPPIAGRRQHHTSIQSRPIPVRPIPARARKPNSAPPGF